MRMYTATLAFFLSHALIDGRGILANDRYKAADVQEGGSIRGIVRLTSGARKAEAMAVSKDDRICGKSKPSPRLVVGKDGGVANTLVYIHGIVRGKKFGDVEKVTLNQTKCEYQPHIVLVPPDAEFEIVNSDKILHNVHAYDISADMKTIFNIAQPIAGQKTTVKARPKDGSGLALATCDAGHPWMSAFIVYMEHPYYTVTDASGSFVLKDVPPGTYTLKMWHEGVRVARTELEKGVVKKYYYEEPYEAEQEVTVPPSGMATVSYDLSLR